MAKRLIISREAYLHIDRIVEFNNTRNQSKSYSIKFIKALFEEFEILREFPFIGMETSRKNTHLLLWNDYYIYYSVTEKTIEIKFIYHQKENVDR